MFVSCITELHKCEMEILLYPKYKEDFKSCAATSTEETIGSAFIERSSKHH